MRSIFIPLSGVILGVGVAFTASFAQAPSEASPFFKNMKQITFEGPRAGEGYFSADGQKMVFQSERHEGNPFYQIYLLDLKSGETQKISTGAGNTTCAWIHPDKRRIMFSSTHLDPGFNEKVKAELAERASPVKKRYSWSYDEYYDIFERDLKTQKLKRLTKEKGYDAEGSYSPDGKWIAFASNRKGYEKNLVEEDRKIFEKDSSFMMDIYIMKSDGTQVKQLTTAKGYDGGPFFSADGKKITWRRFTPSGQIAEIWTMNVDGSQQKQITRLGMMSWAPYFHPSGDYIIFASNKEGYTNFELYMVDAEGVKDPVRVTFLEGFDGLPVFTPDGKKISFTRRGNKGDSQIYLADWDDKAARLALGLPEKTPRVSSSSPVIKVEDLRSWAEYLASPFMKGRKPGSAEEKVYTQAIADFFKDLGLVPLIGNSFFQEFEFTSGVKLGSGNSVEVSLPNGKTKTLKVSEDFLPLSFSKQGEFPSADVVFAGYGLKAPGEGKFKTYDSYAGIDVAGKWALAFRDIPEEVPNEHRIFLNTFSRLQHKALAAKQAGAVGLLLVNGPQSTSRKLLALRFDGAQAMDSGIPVLHLSNEAAEDLLAKSGKNLKELQKANDKGEIFTDVKLSSKVRAQVNLEFERTKAVNVLAKLPTGKSIARSISIIGAHGDHLGTGEMGSSLAQGAEQGQIHYGADDNASGVAAVMEMAQAFAKNPPKNLQSDLGFAIWSAEEVGLIGAERFLDEAKSLRISNYFNLDMVGRYREKLSIQSVGSAKEWKSLIERAIPRTDLSLSLTDDPYLPTDSMAFYMKSIPTLHFFTGAHSEYHTPRDTVDKLNFEGLASVTELVQGLVVSANQANQKLSYLKVEGSQKQMQGRSFRIYLGTIPDYAGENVKGVKISGTAKGSPAEKAGLLPGDVIVELAKTKVENIYDYVYLLQSMKPNEVTNVKVQRQAQGKMHIQEMQITPLLKE
ncbi:MAG: M20/M25/M40 family metallo-hydrolase [Pseudobdellovibrionaceae bacterium]